MFLYRCTPDLRGMKNLRAIAVLFLALQLVACNTNDFEFTTSLNDSGSLTNSVLNFDESFIQNSVSKKVDILFVVDNSGSMAGDQEKLSREFTNFISNIKDSNYRIGLITTDVDSIGFEDTPGYHGNLAVIEKTGKKFISSEDSNPDELFAKLILRDETLACELDNPDTCASYRERPLHAVKQAMRKKDDINAGFFRDSASLVIMIITDEDESPNVDDEYFEASGLVEKIDEIFEGKKETLAFSIAILEGDQACFDEQELHPTTGPGAVSYGIRVGELADLTGGFKVNICNEDFGQDVEKIGSFVNSAFLPFVHKLPESLDIDSLTVSVRTEDGDEFTTEVIVQDQILSFDPLPPVGSKIDIKYNF